MDIFQLQYHLQYIYLTPRFEPLAGQVRASNFISINFAKVLLTASYPTEPEARSDHDTKRLASICVGVVFMVPYQQGAV
jgi:hypothetical protein